jgi:type II secretory pathway component GspD/PulD (secretin)
MHAASDRRRWSRRRLLQAALAALTSAALPTHGQTAELRVIPLRHRLAAELIPTLEPLLGPGETVTGMDSRLIVRATPANLAQLEGVINELDVARRNLRITVRQSTVGATQEQARSVSGEIRRDGSRVVVSGDPRVGGTGITVGRQGPDSRAQAYSVRRTTTARENLDQTLVVMDGGQGVIRIGESIPVVQPFLALVGDRLPVAVGVEFYDVTTGFAVAPRLHGDTVQLAIAPRLSFRSSRGLQVIDVRELSTTVALRRGEWLDLGGAVESTNDLNRQIFATHRSARHEATRILVRVD